MIHFAAVLTAVLAIAVVTPVDARPGAAAPVISGARTNGGEGGREYLVTSLNDDGPGSLRAALEMPGPAIVKFRVGGVIRLQTPLKIRESRVTVAGESAPSPGITLSGASLRIRASDVIVRHLRIRVGDRPGQKPDDRDGITILGDDHGQGASSNVLIENCSVSWAIDENVSLWFPGIQGVTVRNSIIAEGLDNSLHSKGPHSMGLLVGNGARDVVVQGNLFAHNRYRNPVLKAGVTALVINNLIYDPAGAAVHFYGGGDDGPALASIQGNVIRRGPSTPKVMDLFGVNGPSRGSRIHMADNDGDGTGAFERRWPEKVRPPFDPFVDTPPVRAGAMIVIRPASATYDTVLESAGARPWERDATDKRIISEVLSRGGGMRDAPPPAENP